ncbi:MAG: GGDEF domain-containing protein [Phycisphaeraceae bacterium]|nr:GGDEF domain-containing protein [Phycisphaeraceae bacterium]
MNQELLDRILCSPRLPSLPTIAVEVIELVQRDDVTVRQIAQTISHDPALSSKILKTVNSSFYGQTTSISSIDHALVILGLNSVKTLALGFSLVSNLQATAEEGFDHLTFWKRSLYAAAAARVLAKKIELIHEQEAFLGALLQDLGMLALDQTLGREYRRLALEAHGNHRQLLKLEREQLQLDHTEVGEALGKAWHIPTILLAPIRFHETPSAAPPELQALVRCVTLGNVSAEILIGDDTERMVHRYLQLSNRWFNLPESYAQPLLQAIHNNTVELKRLFDVPTGDFSSASAIMTRANETLTQISLKQQRQSVELEERNRKLAQMASTDALTGVANRRMFNEFLKEQFDDLDATGEPLSLVIMDTDHFKSFNDTHGHQIGDRVLAELAAALRQAAPPAALVARYGGEEFVVVLPGLDRPNATRWAEQTRCQIAKRPFPGNPGQTLQVTVSAGVATAEAEGFTNPEQFIKAADQAVYAAKAAGRNCVRIFAPKPRQPAPSPTAA